MKPVSMEWPYPIKYGEETEMSADVLVLGGGIAGCWAAISAARKGANVLLVEKTATKKSGMGGTGGDHWHYAIESPFCPLDSEEFAQALVDNHKGYNNGIARYIQCRDSYETLLELEAMGAKTRDTEDEFAGAEFRDEETKFLYTYDYVNKYTLRVWGTTFKPVLYRECKRLGVTILDRVMATRLLTDEDDQTRVVGATGVHTRTGGFYVFSAKATILCMAYPGRQWIFSDGNGGMASFPPPTNAGDGHAMAWEAGAELTMMERSVSGMNGTDGGNGVPAYMMGTHANTWYPCTLVDAEGREIPWIDRDGVRIETVSDRCMPAKGQKFFLMGGGVSAAPHPGIYEYMAPRPLMKEMLDEGKLTLPIYADLPSMPEMERKVIFGMMVGEEAKTKIPVVQTLRDAGFDPSQDLLQSYHMIGLSDWLRPPAPSCWRRMGFNPGGPLVDWDLKTSLDGLYAAGDQVFAGNDHSHAATTGRWVGKRASEYASGSAPGRVSRAQVDREKERVYAPTRRKEGVLWQEFNAAVCKVMQDYCGGVRNKSMLNLGLLTMREIQNREMEEVYARNPKELMRVLESFSILSVGEAILHASLAREASSATLHFMRSDFPALDPPEWNKFITIAKKAGRVEVGELPFNYWLPFRENYDKSNKS